MQAWFHSVNTLGIVAMAAIAMALLVVDMRGRGSRALRVMALFLALRAIVNAPTPLELIWPVHPAFWLHVKTYFLLPLPFVVLAFILVYPRDRLGATGRAAILAAGLGVAGLYAFDHTWYATIVPAAGRANAFTAYGPLFYLLGLLYTSYIAAGWRFARLWRVEPGTLQASLGLVSAGFALNGVYLIALEAALALTPHGDAFGRHVLIGMAPGVPFALLLGRECWLAVRSSVPGARAYLGALVAAPAVAVAEVALTVSETLPVLGYADAVFLLAQPAMLAYALLRHRLFGIDLRVKWSLQHGTTLGIAAAVLLLADTAGDRLLPPRAAAAIELIAVLALLLLLAHVQRLSRRLAEAALPGVAPTPQYLAARRQLLDLAAVEQDARGRGASSGHGPADPAHMAIPGVTVLERYVLKALLGRSGTIATWLARDRRTGGLVVIKFAGPAGREALRREATLLAKLDHPNVIQVLGTEEAGDGLALILSYAAGGSLQQRLARGTMTWPQVRALARDVASGLHAIHAAGLIHRDIKPANLLYDGKRWIVADLGIAAGAEPGAPGAGLRGSVAYMSPEQAAERPLSPATDWWSFGVVLYRALTGRMPMDTAGLPDFDARAAILEDPVDLPIDAPGDANQLLERLLQKDPERRRPLPSQVPVSG